MFHAQKSKTPTLPTPDQARRETETEPAPPGEETMAEFEMLRVPPGFKNAFAYFCDAYGLDQEDALEMGKYVFGALADGAAASWLFDRMRPTLNGDRIRGMMIELAKQIQELAEASPAADSVPEPSPTSDTTAEPRAQ